MDELGIRDDSVSGSQERPLADVYKCYTYFADNDVLLAKITPCFQNGKLGIARALKNGIGFGSSEFFVLRCDDRLLPEFLFYYLGQDDFIEGGVASMGGAVGHQRVPPEYVLGRSIPLPPLSEQRRIVSVLDAVFAGLATATANTQTNLRNARELFETHLNTATDSSSEDWSESTIGETCNFIDYRGKTPKKTESGLRLVTAKNVRMGYLRREPEEFVSPDTYDGWMTRGIPQFGDVLFTTEAPLGLVAQLDTDEKVVFAQRIITLQPDQNRIDSAFFKYLLMSRRMQARIHEKGTGATAKGIKASLLKKIPFSYPSDMRKQKSISASLGSLTESVERMAEVANQKLANLEELKQSILHRAFRGELTGDGSTLNTNLMEAAGA